MFALLAVWNLAYLGCPFDGSAEQQEQVNYILLLCSQNPGMIKKVEKEWILLSFGFSTNPRFNSIFYGKRNTS